MRRSISNKKLTEARKRIQKADSSERNKLRNRTTRSLVLIFDSQLYNILVALKELGKMIKYIVQISRPLQHSIDSAEIRL